MKNLSQNKQKIVINLLKLLATQKIDALPMKLYSDDDDMDIVIIDKQIHKDAMNLLITNGWSVKNNRSKIRERDKDFFFHPSFSYVTHLHQAFSWNTVPYLDSRKLWQRKREIDGLILPSVEDELLIIAAHSLFENQYIKNEELIYGRKLLERGFNLRYMKSHAADFHWGNGLDLIIDKLKKNTSSLSINELVRIKINKLKQDFMSVPISQYMVEILNYFCIDWIWNYRIMLQRKLTRRPIIITLSGVDGTGKTTAANFIYKLCKSQGTEVKIIHSGTTPFVNTDKSTNLLDIPFFDYAIFTKDALRIIYLLVRNIGSEVLIFDRYIYDTIVKIAYKQRREILNKSFLWISSKIIPKPNILFLFDLPHSVSQKRDINHSIHYHKEKRELYQKISKNVSNFVLIDSTNNKNEVNSIIAKNLEYFQNSRL